MASGSHGILSSMSEHVLAVGGHDRILKHAGLVSQHIQRVHAGERQSWRSEFTPLPGVSAPAGPRRWPQAPQSAAAQRSLCPVPADNGTLAWRGPYEFTSHHHNKSLCAGKLTQNTCSIR